MCNDTKLSIYNMCRLLWWIHPKLPAARTDTLLKVNKHKQYKITV